jgi:hypothetical protein
MAANPDINPNALTVGTQVIIPLGNIQTQIGSVSEPLALDVGLTECAATIEGGLWCFALVSNPLDQSATSVSISFVLTDSNGKTLEKKVVPLLLDKIDPGQSIPASAYFVAPAPSEFSVTASLVSALPLSESGLKFLPAMVANSQVEPNVRTAQVSGEIEVAGEPGSSVILHVVGIAFDSSGQLAGVRRSESEISLEPGNAVDFVLNLYSYINDIESVSIIAEAYLTDNS